MLDILLPLFLLWVLYKVLTAFGRAMGWRKPKDEDD